jgi:hypothetical protein
MMVVRDQEGMRHQAHIPRASIPKSWRDPKEDRITP